MRANGTLYGKGAILPKALQLFYPAWTRQLFNGVITKRQKFELEKQFSLPLPLTYALTLNYV
jgi:hypothetical protein